MCTLPSRLQPCPQPDCPLQTRSMSPPWAALMGPLRLQALQVTPRTHTGSPLSRAQTCALTLLAGFQLFYFQVMGELWKRNQTGLSRSIPLVPRAPCVSLCSLPVLPGHWQSPWLWHCLCPAHGVSVAISEHQPQAEPKIDDSSNSYIIKQP